MEMKVDFPCKSYDSEEHGSIWCEGIMKNRDFDCPNKDVCTHLVEEEIDKSLRSSVKKTSVCKRESKEALIKELEHTQEFAKVI